VTRPDRSRAIRPWRLNCAVTALHAAFPGAKVHIRDYDPRAGFADFVVSQPIVITDENRELLAMMASWGPRRLRIAAEVLNACENEAAIAALITTGVPKMKREAAVELGPVIAPTQRQRGPWLGQRVDPDALREQLRGAVIRVKGLGTEST